MCGDFYPEYQSNSDLFELINSLRRKIEEVEDRIDKLEKPKEIIK